MKFDEAEITLHGQMRSNKYSYIEANVNLRSSKVECSFLHEGANRAKRMHEQRSNATKQMRGSRIFEKFRTEDFR